MFVYTIKHIIIAILIIIGLLYFLFEFIKYHFKKIFYKNCFECKYWKLHDVSSCGGPCTYKCTKKDSLYRINMNRYEYRKNCKLFYSKTNSRDKDK